MKCTEGLLFWGGQNDHFDVREATGCSRSYIAMNGAPSNRNHQPQVEDNVCLIQEFKNLENQESLTFKDQTGELHNFPGRRCQVPFVFKWKVRCIGRVCSTPSDSGKWRFNSGSSTENIISHPGAHWHTERGPHPMYWSYTIPETNIFAPENGWLEDDPFLLGWPIFKGELLVLGSVRVYIYPL